MTPEEGVKSQLACYRAMTGEERLAIALGYTNWPASWPAPESAVNSRTPTPRRWNVCSANASPWGVLYDRARQSPSERQLGDAAGVFAVQSPALDQKVQCEASGYPEESSGRL